MASPDLLASGPGRFSCRALAARQTGIFLQLVGTVERRRVERRHQAGPNTDAIDRRFFAREFRKRALVDSAAYKDPGIVEPARVQNPAHALCKCGQIAAVDPYRT